MEENVFYVGVKDPPAMRRDCLLASKALLDILKRHEEARSLRSEKAEYVVELRRVFDEILVLNRKLRSKMPKVQGEPAFAEPKAAVPEKKMPAKARTHMDVLEEELSKIEQRLEALR